MSIIMVLVSSQQRWFDSVCETVNDNPTNVAKTEANLYLQLCSYNWFIFTIFINHDYKSKSSCWNVRWEKLLSNTSLWLFLPWVAWSENAFISDKSQLEDHYFVCCRLQLWARSWSIRHANAPLGHIFATDNFIIVMSCLSSDEDFPPLIKSCLTDSAIITHQQFLTPHMQTLIQQKDLRKAARSTTSSATGRFTQCC